MSRFRRALLDDDDAISVIFNTRPKGDEHFHILLARLLSATMPRKLEIALSRIFEPRHIR